MKKKILLTLLIVSLLACSFAITVGATVPEWTETQDLGFSPKTTTDGTVTFDTTSRVMLSHTKSQTPLPQLEIVPSITIQPLKRWKFPTL